MFKFLGTIATKPEHPLTHLEAITRWMDDLPMGDSVKVIEALTLQIKEYSDQGQVVTLERLAILNAIDEGAQDLIEILRGQYLQNPRMSRVVESRLWNTVNAYYHEAIRAYHAHIMEYIGNPGTSKIAGAMPGLTARALRYFGLSAIWGYYRFMQADPKFWKRMNNLYHFAEYSKFETRRLQLYEQDLTQTSMTQLYLESLMLDTLNTGSLTPRQIHLIERWMPMLVRDVELERNYQPERHAFCVNLAESRSACRAQRVTPSKALRYWATQDIKAQLDALRNQIAAGAIPAKLGLTEDCRVPACLELLERLANLWAPGGQKQTQRAFERKHSVKPIDVVRGLNDICLNVRADNLKGLQHKAAQPADTLNYDEMVDVHLYGFVTKRTQTKAEQGRVEQSEDEKIESVIVHERWVMENESEGGYGAHIADQTDDWVRIGKLVGLKPGQKGNWRVGVIRRMLRTEARQQYVGIELLVERSMVLAMRAEQNERQSLSVEGIDTVDVKIPFSALFLKGGGQSTRTDTLILLSAEYANGRELWFGVRGTTYHIRLKEALERGDDWLRVAFEVVAKHAATPSK